MTASQIRRAAVRQSLKHPTNLPELALNRKTAKTNSTIRDYNAVLQGVIKSLGQRLDSSSYNDRGALGKAMVEHKRKQRTLRPGGCPAEFSHCDNQ